MESRLINEIVDELIGDTPVSVQLAMALDDMASKKDLNDLRLDIDAIKKELEKLIELVGDTSISEQINMAIKNVNKV